jgi:DNA primase
MSGRIPQDFINDLIDRADIIEIISSRIQLKKAGREYKACCPFHGEKTPSFTVSPDKGFYHCFGCGAHGTVVGFLMEHDQLEFVEAIEELASLNGVEVPRDKVSQPTSPTSPLYELLEQASQLYREQLRKHPTAVDYLKKRGLDGDTAAHYQIGYAPAGWDFLLKRFGANEEGQERLLKTGLVLRNDEGRVYDRFRDRIMFPIRDSRGRIVGFGGRVMDKGEPKYLNSPETPVFHKGRELYGLYDARKANRKLERLLVVEGYMDVAALGQHGITNAVATLGTATTADHLQRLFRASNEIVFCFDGDRAGRDAAWRALQITLPELRDGRQVKFLFLADGQDPDSVVTEHGADIFNQQLEQSQPLSDYLLDHLRAETDLSSMDGLARLAELTKPLLNRIPEGVYQELLLDKLAGEVGLSAERLAQLLGDSDSRQASAPAAPQARPRARHGRPGAVRQAVQLVLHRPKAASQIKLPEGFETLNNPGMQLLGALLEAAIANPGIKPARLAESLAEHPDGGSHLLTLLTQDHALDGDSNPDGNLRWDTQLQDTLDRIVREDLQRRFSDLTAKANQGLSAAEKEEFRNLQTQLAGPRSNTG